CVRQVPAANVARRVRGPIAKKAPSRSIGEARRARSTKKRSVWESLWRG
ncbi:MAG: hypothetical protein AVDCRST_MAG73-4104, partial [uncultured Thermomicrobiales bacterium]